MLNSAIAFCCAVEPSAVSVFFPPQSAEADDELPAALEEEVPALLSLPHAVSVKAAIAVAETVVPSTLPKRLSFTYPTFDCRPQDSPATYASVVDGSRMKCERKVNRLSSFTAEGLTQGVRDIRAEDLETQLAVRPHGR